MLEHSLMLPERNNVTQCGNGLTLTPNCHPGKSIVPFWKLTKWNCSAVFSHSALFSTSHNLNTREKPNFDGDVPATARKGPFAGECQSWGYLRWAPACQWNDWSFSWSHFHFNSLRPIFTFNLIGWHWPSKRIWKEHQNAADPGPTRCWRLGCATDSVWSFRVQHFAASILQAVCLPTSERLKGHVVTNHE